MTSLIGGVLFFSIYFFWLMLSLVLAFMGFLIKGQNESLDLEFVKIEKTICKVLNQKGLLTDKEYDFETNEVAGMYDRHTFTGYLFIMKPVIYFIENFNSIDRPIMFLVRKWMVVHREKLNHLGQGFYFNLANFCVGLAKNVGNVLSHLAPVKIEDQC